MRASKRTCDVNNASCGGGGRTTLTIGPLLQQRPQQRDALQRLAETLDGARRRLCGGVSQRAGVDGAEAVKQVPFRRP